jgi:Cft2 family RNA processing exonuclease
LWTHFFYTLIWSKSHKYVSAPHTAFVNLFCWLKARSIKYQQWIDLCSLFRLTTFSYGHLKVQFIDI